MIAQSKRYNNTAIFSVWLYYIIKVSTTYFSFYNKDDYNSFGNTFCKDYMNKKKRISDLFVSNDFSVIPISPFLEGAP